MKSLACSIIVFLASIFKLGLGDTVSPRTYGICVYLQRKLFCYGGVDLTSRARQQPDMVILNDFYYLDISGDFAVSNISSSWVRIYPQGSLQAEPNAFYSIATIPSNNTIVISGGIGRNDHTLLVNPTMAYNSRANSWSVLSGNSGTQAYAAGAGIHMNNKIYIWGGVSDTATGYQYQEYQRDMRILDFNIGGEQQILRTAENGDTYYDKQLVSMTNILQYDIASAQWSGSNTTGDTPTTRLFHAAARKPNTNEIIVYGGSTQIDANTSRAVDDFCCVLDTTMLTWRIVNLSSTQGAGPRVGHSVVFLENSSYMLVLFGFGQQGQIHMEIQVLDTNTYQWIEHYQGPGPLPADEGGDGEDNVNGSSGFSSGTIASIVVGVVAVGGLITAVFFLYRRRKQLKNYGQSEIDSSSPLYSSDIKLSQYEPPHTHDDTPKSSRTDLSSHHIVKAGGSTPLPSKGLLTSEDTTSLSRPLLNIQSQSIEVESMKPDGSTAYYVPRLALHPVKPDHFT